MLNPNWIRTVVASVAIFALFGLAPQAARAAVPWQSDWTVADPGRATWYASIDDARSEMLLTYRDSLMRVTAGGTVRFVRGLGSLDSQLIPLGRNTVATADDGGSYVANAASNAVARLDGAGNLAWTRQLPVDRIAATADGGVLLADVQSASTIVTRVDASGSVLWQQSFAAATAQGYSVVLAVDETGAAVISNPLASGALLTRLTPSGAIAWQSVKSARSTSLRATAAHVYATEGVVQVYSGADGSAQWNAPLGALALVPGTGDPIFVRNDTDHVIERRSATTGAVLWSVPSNGLERLHVHDANVLYAWNDGYVSRLDAVTGAVTWTVAPAVAAGHQQTNAVFAADAAMATVSTDCDANGLCVARLRTYSSGVGTPLAEQLLPLDEVAPLGRSVEGPGGDIYTVALVDPPLGFEVVARPVKVIARRQSRDTGAVLWEQSLPPTTSPNAYQACAIADVAAAGSTLAFVLYCNARSLFMYPTYSGFVRAGSFDTTTGALRWSANIADAGEYTYAPALLVADNGDVVVGQTAYGIFVDIPMTPAPTVKRLAAVDGHELWKRTTKTWSPAPGESNYPKLAAGTGSLVVLRPPDDTPAGTRYAGLDPLTGATLWSSAASNVSSDSLLFATADGHAAIASAATGTQASGVPTVTKINSATGAVLWTYQHSDSVAGDVYTIDDHGVAANGDIVVAGRITAADGTQRPWVVRLALGDGQPVFDRILLGTGLAHQAAIALQAEQQGVIPMRQYASVSDSLGIVYLTSLDAASGQVLGGQALAFAPNGPVIGGLVPQLIGPARSGLLALAGRTFGPHAYAYRTAVVDTNVASHGNLSVSVTADSPPAIGATAPFAVHVAYAGDQPITNAEVIAYLPWQGTTSTVSCTGSGVVRCDVDLTSGQVHASVDLASSASFDLTGTIRRLPQSASAGAAVQAVAKGPVSLRESSFGDNFAGQRVDDYIFVDGYE